MDNLKPGFDISEQEAERISSDMMAGLHAIKAENYWNVVLREGTGLPPPSTLERPTLGGLELTMKIGERKSGYALHEEASRGSRERTFVGRRRRHHMRCRSGTIKCLWRSNVQNVQRS
ncbi:hypothetical protein ARMGADRAFT_429024 [Armillaria gallica]|uniref:Uncharacterized protein n=1 Tax=Armillaria gallica TaxID=47427 RepID=A0A2H3DGS9_ARMGA|nr:hypothetical protein ARMGADRAFT_429024 [Armillaria gallica]